MKHYRRNSGSQPFESLADYEDWKRQHRAGQEKLATTSAGKLAIRHGGNPRETGEMSIGWGPSPHNQRIRYGHSLWDPATLPTRFWREAPTHEGREAIAEYILANHVPPSRVNPRKRKNPTAEPIACCRSNPTRGKLLLIDGKPYVLTSYSPHESTPSYSPKPRTIGETGWGRIRRATKAGLPTGAEKEIRFFGPGKCSVENGRFFVSTTYSEVNPRRKNPSAAREVLHMLRPGDLAEITFAPRSSSSPNDVRVVRVSSVAGDSVYTEGAKVRPGHVAGGRIVDYGDEVYFQPTMQQAIRRVISLKRTSVTPIRKNSAAKPRAGQFYLWTSNESVNKDAERAGSFSSRDDAADAADAIHAKWRRRGMTGNFLPTVREFK